MEDRSNARMPATNQETPDNINPWKRVYNPKPIRAIAQTIMMILRCLKPLIGFPNCLKMAKKKIAIITQIKPWEKSPVMALYIPIINKKATPA